jgi:hypothetical protein
LRLKQTNKVKAAVVKMTVMAIVQILGEFGLIKYELKVIIATD